jgi:thymidylate synthase ThyX
MCSQELWPGDHRSGHIYIVRCFEVTRHRHASRVSFRDRDTRLVADLPHRGNESTVTFSKDDRPFLCGPREDISSRTLERIEEKSKKEFNRTVRSSSRVKKQFKGRSSSSSEKAVQVGVQEAREPSCLVGPERRAGPVGPRGM